MNGNNQLSLYVIE